MIGDKLVTNFGFLGGKRWPVTPEVASSSLVGPATFPPVNPGFPLSTIGTILTLG